MHFHWLGQSGTHGGVQATDVSYKADGSFSGYIKTFGGSTEGDATGEWRVDDKGLQCAEWNIGNYRGCYF